jgi:hypothetical protein
MSRVNTVKNFFELLISSSFRHDHHFSMISNHMLLLTLLISVSLPYSRKSEGRSCHLHWLSSPAGIVDWPTDVIEAWLIFSL